MLKPASSLKHRLQLGAALVASVGSVCILSCVVDSTARPKPVPGHVRYVPPPPLVMPKVIVPPAPQTPHISAALSAAIDRGDVKAVEKAYAPEDSLDIAYERAAPFGKRDVIAWLLDKGADVHLDELTERAPLLQADEHPDVTQLLLDRGVTESELATAIQARAPNAVGRILAMDKDKKQVRAPGARYLSDAIAAMPAASAERHASRRIVEKLLAAGADVNAGEPLAVALATCNSPDGSSAEPEPECVAMVKAILARRPDITGGALVAVMDLDDGPGRTKLLDALLAGKLQPDATAIALGHAAPERDAPLVRRLASRGVAWTYHDGEADGVAPLVDAVDSQDVALVRLLLDSGAPADHHYKDGRSALGSAIESATAQAERIVELLVQRGANVNRRLPDGRSPLFAAAEAGSVRIVKAMLAAGARVNERVLDETALDAAERSGNTAVARILDGHGGRRAPSRNQRESPLVSQKAGPQNDAMEILKAAMGATENTL